MVEKSPKRQINPMEQQNPRVEYKCTGVRPETIGALRWMLSGTGKDEGEFLSELFEQAVAKEYSVPVLNHVKEQFLKDPSFFENIQELHNE